MPQSSLGVVPTYRFHDTIGDDHGFLEHPVHV